MAHKKIVLVDGVSDYWGERVAKRLVEDPKLHVIGIAEEPPEQDIKGLDFIQISLHNPLLIDLLQAEAVEAVCHVAFVESQRPTESVFEYNVMGTMKLLGACAEAGVRKIVLKSSTLVYGAQPTNSAFLREDQPLQGTKGYGYVRDLVEIEGFCNGYLRQSEVALTILRFANVVGPKADTPLTRFLREEEAFVLMGFDPMMQVIHEDDVVGALVHALNRDVPGVFNVAAHKSLPLWRLMGLANKVPTPVFHPLAYGSVSVLGPRYAPIDLDYLRYPCVADLHRMETELGYQPVYTAEEVLREFASQQRLRHYLPESLAQAFEEERVRDILERRRRQRQRLKTQTTSKRKVKRAGRPAGEAATAILEESNNG